VISLLRRYLVPYRGRIMVVLVLLLVQAIGNLYLPTLNGDIINDGVAKGDTDYIVRVGGLMLLVSLALGVAAILGVYWGAQVAMGFGRDVRSAIFRTVQAFSQVEVNRFGPPSLITRNTNDVQQVQTVVFMALTLMISAPILIIGGIVMALRQDVPLSGLLVVVLPIMVAFIAVVMSRAIPMFQAMQVKVDRINQVMRETLAGVRVIRAFVRTRHEEERFQEASVDLFDTALKVNRLFAVTIPVMTGLWIASDALSVFSALIAFRLVRRIQAGQDEALVAAANSLALETPFDAPLDPPVDPSPDAPAPDWLS
jgi:ATP-binding cassette subfamily B protein